MASADPPLVSILINNYNYGRYLAAAIESALGQTYVPIEVIVVDDGSTDDSRSVIAGYGDAVVPVLKPNGGQASAFNAGFAASQGEIVCLFDADDVFELTKASEIVSVFTAHPKIEWLMHPLAYVDRELIPLGANRQKGRSAVCDVRAAICRGRLGGLLPFDGTATSGLCFRRFLLERILPMPEDRLIFDDYLKFAAMALGPGYVASDAWALQRLHGENAMTGRPERLCDHMSHLIATAHWWRQRIPELGRFADNIFAMATGSRRAMGCSELTLDGRVTSYVGWTEPRRLASIRLRQVYHWLRVKRQRATGRS